MEKPFIGRRFGCCQCSQTTPTKTVMSCVIYLEQRTNYAVFYTYLFWLIRRPGGVLGAR